MATTNYVMIDFESVQPKNLDILRKHPFRILVFVGVNQGKVPFELAAAMQRLGADAQYIKIGGSGKNLLGRGSARPRKVKTLANTINPLFTEKLGESELAALIQSMQDRQLIRIKGGNVSYSLQMKS